MDLEDANVPAWLDPAFFEKTLLDAGDFDADAEVVAVDVRKGVAKGENFGSFMHKAAVTIRKGNGQQDTKHLMVKSLPDGDAFVKLLLESDIFKKESFVYSLLLPRFRRLQEKAGTPVTPLGCAHYRTSRPNTVAMEDLSARGFRVADRRQRLDLEHCRMALHSLARFHGLSLGALREDPSLKETFPDTFLTVAKRAENHHYQDRNVEGLAKEVEKWKGFEEYADRLRSSNMVDKVIDYFAVDTKFAVLCHGDCWLNNMMFRYSDTGKVEDLLFVDFQICRYISVMYDLQYFRYSSANDEVRENHWDALISEYYDEFVNTLRSIGCKSEVKFSLAELRHELDDTKVIGLFTAILVLPIVLADPERAPDFAQLDAFDADAPVDAHAPERKCVMTAAYQGERYRKAMEKMLPELKRAGVL